MDVQQVKEVAAKELWLNLSVFSRKPIRLLWRFKVKKLMKLKILFTLLTLIGIKTSAQKSLDELLKKHNKEHIPYITVTELQQLKSQGDILILDSRERNEFDVSHIPSAKFAGYDHFLVKEYSGKIKNKETPIVVYCTIGIRSNVVANKLQKEGFLNIKNLYGGICEWKNKGYPVVDTTETATENVHIFSEEWGKWLLNGRGVYD